MSLKKCGAFAFVPAIIAGVVMVGLVGRPAPAAAAEAPSAEEVLRKLGVKRGLVVVAGGGAAARAVEIARRSKLRVYVQLGGPGELDAACRAAESAGLLGARVFIDSGPAGRIGLADNLADGLVAIGPAASALPAAEVLRVLRPGGKAILGRRALAKPPPDRAGDWSHPYHGPDNNPFSRDRRVRAPFLTQFMTGPQMGPVPQLTVASAGRVFKLYGHLGLRRPSHPYVNKLVAYNGYNGTILWERKLKAGFMSLRPTLVATPQVVYLGDDESCKQLDAATGRVKGQLTVPAERTDGPVWKWLAIDRSAGLTAGRSAGLTAGRSTGLTAGRSTGLTAGGGVLYGLLGPAEEKAPEVRFRSDRGGWGWKETTPGFARPDPDFPWMFGRTLVAIDLSTGRLLWTHREQHAIDGRAVGVRGGRLFFFRFGRFLACLDARTGREVWRRTPKKDPELFKAMGKYVAGPNSGSVGGGGFPTVPYLICSDKAVCLTGLPLKTLTVVSADDGKLLYGRRYTGHLMIDGDRMYAIAYGTVVDYGSWRLDLTTGKVLGRFAGGLACARPTGCPGGLFYRGREGTVYYEPATGRVRHIALMRPSCTDGVTIANGRLYWWPWLCGCNFSLRGVICVVPAGGFKFNQRAADAERLQRNPDAPARPAELTESPEDWSSIRAESLARSRRPDPAAVAWERDAAVPPEVTLTAPVTAGGLVFVGGSDGTIRCLDAATGKPRWKAFTGGPVRVPPTIWKGRALTGSGDGWVYAHEAASGKLLWRFRAAPADRKIPVHGSLCSTWPVNSGVAVAQGVAFFAAGITNYDGTHVYALDAVTGKIKWQNNRSGQLNPRLDAGVSAQGMVLVHGGKLYLAGGNVVSPAVYDAATGKCLNKPPGKYQPGRNNTRGRSGWALSVKGGQVKASGPRFYTPGGPFFRAFDPKAIVGRARDRHGRTFLVRRDGHVLCLKPNQ